MKSTAPTWLMPVVAIFALQTASAFLSRLIPIVAPAIAEEFGWNGSSIGYLSASNALGGLVFLVAGSSLLRQIGGTRMLQLLLILGAACMGFFLYPSMGIALAVCCVMGMSNGAANPAGSEVLQRFSPPGMRNLMFSIKQAGVPLGGMMAGLFVPVVIALAGWRFSLFVFAFLVLLPTVLTWKLSAVLDETSKVEKRSGSWMPTMQSLRIFVAPLTSITQDRGLLKMSIVGSLFAVPQSCWFAFTVIYLVDGLGFSLSLAGVVFAVMQLGGVFGRIALGWISDYLRSSTATLSIAALFSAVTTVLLGLTTPEWPLWSIIVLALISGCTTASWNGVHIAEVARRSPPNLIAETSAGAAILVSVVNIVAPTVFAILVATTGRYDIAFLCVGVCALLVLVILPRDRR
ncbi:MFS transporter [Paracandidimonas soli]|uniref:Nitrate/nitrite transporter NarK n=2 Tax=Paracandidimonas soli TaxID=1917182 RepID=A0A4R3UY20_9BURK|nr:nitrate/nitrite transporter NarK [Paracandidimonas soli]